MAGRVAMWGVGVVFTAASAALAFACTAGTSSAGSDSPDGGGASGSACVFMTRTVYVCPNEPDQPSPWATECIDNSNCSGLAPSSQQSQGCIGTTQIQSAVSVPGTCAALTSSTSPTTTDSGAIVLDSGSVAEVCAPGDASAFTPVWHPPRPKQSSCSTALIQSFIQCLDDSSTNAYPTSCQPWANPTGDNKTCLTCLESSPGDPSWGPLLILPDETLLNVPGCMALAEGDTTGTGCGAKYQADEECGRAACAPGCPIGATNPTVASQEIALETSCEAVAGQYDGGVCSKWAVPAACVGAIAQEDAGTPAEQACLGLPTQSNDAILLAVATAFCGE